MLPRGTPLLCLPSSPRCRVGPRGARLLLSGGPGFKTQVPSPAVTKDKLPSSEPQFPHPQQEGPLPTGAFVIGVLAAPPALCPRGGCCGMCASTDLGHAGPRNRQNRILLELSCPREHNHFTFGGWGLHSGLCLQTLRRSVWISVVTRPTPTSQGADYSILLLGTTKASCGCLSPTKSLE